MRRASPPRRAAGHDRPGRRGAQLGVEHGGGAGRHVVLGRRHAQALLDHAQLGLGFPAFSVLDLHLLSLSSLQLQLASTGGTSIRTSSI